MSLEAILYQYSDIQLWREPVKRIRSILDSEMPDIVVPTPSGFNNYFVNNEFLATLENILQSSADPKELVLEESKRPQMRNQAPSFIIEPIDQIIRKYKIKSCVLILNAELVYINSQCTEKQTIGRIPTK